MKHVIVTSVKILGRVSTCFNVNQVFNSINHVWSHFFASCWVQNVGLVHRSFASKPAEFNPKACPPEQWSCLQGTYSPRGHQRKCLKRWVNSMYLKHGFKVKHMLKTSSHPLFHQKLCSCRISSWQEQRILPCENVTKRWRLPLSTSSLSAYFHLHCTLNILNLQSLGRLQPTWRNSSWTQRCHRNPADAFSCQWNFIPTGWGMLQWNQGEGSQVKHSWNAKRITKKRTSLLLSLQQAIAKLCHSGSPRWKPVKCILMSWPPSNCNPQPLDSHWKQTHCNWKSSEPFWHDTRSNMIQLEYAGMFTNNCRSQNHLDPSFFEFGSDSHHYSDPHCTSLVPGRMRNAQARHVMTSGSGDMSTKPFRWGVHFAFRHEKLTLWRNDATCYQDYQVYVAIRCDALRLATRNASRLSLPSNSGRTWPASSTHEDNLPHRSHTRRAADFLRPLDASYIQLLWKHVSTDPTELPDHWYHWCSRLPYCTQ